MGRLLAGVALLAALQVAAAGPGGGADASGATQLTKASLQTAFDDAVANDSTLFVRFFLNG